VHVRVVCDISRYSFCFLRGLVLEWGWNVGMVFFVVQSASNMVRERVGRCPVGSVQVFSRGEYRFV
jgi:hypothetical protein